MGRFLSSDGRCDRARAWASLELDGELSQLERALLAAHTRRCESCAAFAAELRALTETLRSAPLDVPARPFVLPAPRPVVRYRRFALRVSLATVLAGLAAGLGVLAGSLSRDSDDPVSPTGGDVALLTPGSTNQPVGAGVRDQRLTEPGERLFPPARSRRNL